MCFVQSPIQKEETTVFGGTGKSGLLQGLDQMMALASWRITGSNNGSPPNTSGKVTGMSLNNWRDLTQPYRFWMHREKKIILLATVNLDFFLKLRDYQKEELGVQEVSDLLLTM